MNGPELPPGAAEQVEKEIVTLALEPPLVEPIPEALQSPARFLLKAELPLYPNTDLAMTLRDKDSVINQRLMPTTAPDRSAYDRVRAKVEAATGGNALRAFFFATLDRSGTHVGVDVTRAWQQPW